MHLLLSGIVGSVAYGLAGPGSDGCYETRTETGDRLIAIRSASAPRVRDAYLGYASQQFRKLTTRDATVGGRRRSAKHARHLARLLHQGRTLYATGRLEIRLADPQWFRAFGERVVGGALAEAQALVAEAERDFDRLRTPLPDRPDEATVKRWLRDVRAAHLPAADADASR
ncbi:hypothetical protein [Micromonospora sp. S-DT3-3-22]|uniref:hypothetical protein n=1 Tax=Micromonospora sp. S-DT3-3-22 TaxID=2755359 RepID=UPI00188F9E2F|nr:hypothetical protein [Micromonospora sp. S-DT3-3-22]